MKIKYILLVLLFSLVFTSCTITFDGYSYSIESARNSDPFYNEYDYIFTVQKENLVADFIIHDDLFRIVKFDCGERNGKTLYKIKSKSTFLVSESLTCLDADNIGDWNTTSNFPFQLEWIIVPKSTNSLQDGFCFTYNDKEYILLHRIFD